jgi:hypothetical protein
MTILIMMMFIWNQGTLGLVVSSILMPSQPSTSKSIMIPNNFDEEIAWEVLKPQPILNKKNMGPLLQVVSPLTFFCGE